MSCELATLMMLLNILKLKHWKLGETSSRTTMTFITLQFRSGLFYSFSLTHCLSHLVAVKVATTTTTWKLFNTHTLNIFPFHSGASEFFSLCWLLSHCLSRCQWHEWDLVTACSPFRCFATIASCICLTHTYTESALQFVLLQIHRISVCFSLSQHNSLHFLFHQTDNFSLSFPFTFPMQFITFYAFTCAIKNVDRMCLHSLACSLCICIEHFVDCLHCAL